VSTSGEAEFVSLLLYWRCLLLARFARTWWLAVSILLPGVVAAQTTARVVSVEGDTVTLQVIAGSIVNGDEVEVFTPAGKSLGKVITPAGIDLLLKGDTVKGVQVKGAKVASGAIAATRGTFESYAKASAAAGSGAVAPTPPPPSALKDSQSGCVFTAAEVQAALGFKVKSGKGTELPFPGGMSFSCQYAPEDKKELRSLTVNRLVTTSGDAVTNSRESRKRLAGKLEPVPNDADQAGWQVDQGDLTDVTLHYVRGKATTEVRVGGVNQKDAAAVAAMRKRVLTLRRVE